MEIKVIPHFENVDLLSLYDYKIPEGEQMLTMVSYESEETAPSTPPKAKIPSFIKYNNNFDNHIM